MDQDLAWQEHSWGISVELGSKPHTLAYRAAGNMAWKRKETLRGCTLSWGIQEYHYSYHSGKRGGSRAGADGNVPPLHMVGDWSQRENWDQQHQRALFFLTFCYPKCISGEEGSRYLVPMGIKTITKNILNTSLKQASSVGIALCLTHLTLISFQTVSSWNSGHLNCPLAGNKLKTSHNVIKNTMNNQDFS